MTSRFDVGRRVAAARIARGMNRFQLSKLVGVDSHTLSRVERGDVYQRIDVLLRITDALGVSLNWIAFGNHPPKADRDTMRRLVSYEQRLEAEE